MSETILKALVPLADGFNAHDLDRIMGDLITVDRHHNGPPDSERIELAAQPAPKGRGRPSLYTPETRGARSTP